MKKFKKLTSPIMLDFYSIYEQNGVKTIHVHGYSYESDCYWGDVELCGFEVPLAEFVKSLHDNPEYVNETYMECKQYEDDFTDENEFLEKVIHSYFDGKPADYYLQFEDITEDTPCGCYVHISHINYSVFYDNGDEANDNYLTKDEAYELASKLEAEDYDVMVCKLIGEDWEEEYLSWDKPAEGMKLRITFRAELVLEGTTRREIIGKFQEMNLFSDEARKAQAECDEMVYCERIDEGNYEEVDFKNFL